MHAALYILSAGEIGVEVCLGGLIAFETEHTSHYSYALSHVFLAVDASGVGQCRSDDG